MSSDLFCIVLFIYIDKYTFIYALSVVLICFTAAAPVVVLSEVYFLPNNDISCLMLLRDNEKK